MSIIGAVLAYFFLEGTIRLVVIIGLLATDVVEIAIWLRWRKKRSTTGAEGMVGRIGTAISDCDPEGSVRVMGQIWNARAETPISAGDEIQVNATEGLRLHVSRR